MKTGHFAVVAIAALATAPVCATAGPSESGKAFPITFASDACAAMKATMMVNVRALGSKGDEATPFVGVLTDDATCDGRAILPSGSKIIGMALIHQENVTADGTDTGEPETAWLDVTFQRAVRPDGSSLPVAGALRRTVNLRL